jgi:AraC-like DNA-binding protein
MAESDIAAGVRAESLQAVLRGAEAAGYDLPEILSAHDIDPGLLTSTTREVPLDKYLKLIRSLKQSMGDELIGNGYQPRRLGTNRLVALLCVNTDTLGEAMNRYVEAALVLNSNVSMSLMDRGNQVEFIFSRIPDQPLVNDLSIDLSMIHFHRFMGWLINERMLLNMVKLDYEGQKHTHYRQVFYGAPILVNEEYNSLVFDKRYLDRLVVQSEATLKEYLSSVTRLFHLDMEAGGRLSMEVQDLVVDYMSAHNNALPEMEYVAEKIGLHPQTFRRRLKREGTCFYDIKTQVRRDIAMHNLRHSKQSIEEIGYKTGYTDVGSFIRAFKAWTGLTPLNFRKSLRQ